MYIDSHCHLGFKELGENSNTSQDFLLKASKSNVKAIVNIATEPSNFNNYLNFTSKYLKIFNAIGLHPLHIANNLNFNYNSIQQYLPNKNIIAIGETGFDNYYSTAETELQKKMFEIHAQLSVENKLPLIIHTRCANQITVDYLSRYMQNGGVGGVIHCFAGDKNFAKQLLDIGFYISFSGIVTFKKATDIQETLRYVPLNRMLAETDAPYLAPTPYRGKLNTPEYVTLVYNFIAQYLNVDVVDLQQYFKFNFCNVFNVEL